MERSDFYYDLPQELIAQHPAQKRDCSRLLCMSRETGSLEDKHFYDIRDMLHKGDVLVINNSRVLPARLMGKKATGAVVELLLLKDLGDDRWEVLARPGKRLKYGAEVLFDGASAAVLDELPDGRRIAQFTYDHSFSFPALLDRIGAMPLPPYIKEQLEDNSRYQTVYAKTDGSSAAPTAGLHFTKPLLDELRQKGVEICEITLHVGLGTFRPVKEDNITEHIMHEEFFCVPQQAADTLQAAREQGRRIISVGTTSCRTLETVIARYGKFVPCTESTKLYIYPGYKFGAIDALVTNFHLPESTLIMLVCAFAGYESTMNAYRHAVEEEYRFFSFGDAMFIS